MSYTLVAEKPEVFRAAASVIGTMSGYTWEHRDMIRPVPIRQISGLDDEVIPYDGSMPPAGAGSTALTFGIQIAILFPPPSAGRTGRFRFRLPALLARNVWRSPAALVAQCFWVSL